MEWLNEQFAPLSSTLSTFSVMQTCLTTFGTKYATSHGAISDWIREEFQYQKNDTREQLSQAKSQIHLSFDLWTSPFRNFAVLSIVAHFLNKNNKNTGLLLGLRRNRGSHSGDNMGKLVTRNTERI